MRWPGRRARLALASAVIAATAAPAAAGAPLGPAAAGGGELLPDLDIAAPNGLVVETVAAAGGRRFRLGFLSSVDNVGEGPLVVRGHRASVAETGMTADQAIGLEGGGERVEPGVGVLEYAEDETHQHWHLLAFMRYELRRAAGFELVAPDRKTGFCLGDRYDADPETTLPNEPGERVFDSNCGPLETELLELEQGISVGFGDVYEAWRDAQYIDVTGVPAGRYLLVHRVNPGRPLAESSYANNASSALVVLTWPRGKSQRPKVRVLASCPDTKRCRAR